MYKLLTLIVFLYTANCLADTQKILMKFNEPYSAHVGGGYHRGIDIGVPIGTTVQSIADGKVTFTRTLDISPRSAPVVVIDHGNGISSYYHHINDVTVNVGDTVKQGQKIAVTALTGAAGINTSIPVSVPHLHLSVSVGGIFVDPLSYNLKCSSSKFIWPVIC